MLSIVREPSFMQTAYTVLILLMLVGVSRLVGRVVQLPLPLVQIAAGALLAWPTLGLHMALDPELFLFLPLLLFSDGRRTQGANHVRVSPSVGGVQRFH
ncbi:NhaP-type Na+(K+)/H+ antiporter [Pseudomonas sp. GM48]|nr:NhaP-type Na+(K+)/H+ antiporter [Pseudomonas sp. GM48]